MQICGMLLYYQAAQGLYVIFVYDNNGDDTGMLQLNL